MKTFLKLFILVICFCAILPISQTASRERRDATENVNEKKPLDPIFDSIKEVLNQDAFKSLISTGINAATKLGKEVESSLAKALHSGSEAVQQTGLI